MRSVFALARFSFSIVALAAIVGSGGCNKPTYPECKKDKHCKQDLGEKCTFGKCQNCTTNEDCVGKGPNGENFVCTTEFLCSDPASVPGVGENPEAGLLGSPCTDSAECGGGLVCTQGKCSNCLDDIECPGGKCNVDLGVCEDTQAAGGVVCTTDDQCSMDEICDLGACVFSAVTPSGPNPCGIDAVYFSFDSPKIEDDAKSKLDQIATCLVEQGRLVYLEAHADPRGTEEYNILLTDRRGQTVKQYLTTKGVGAEKMQVVSKGNLEAIGSNEQEWAEDRRVEFVFP